MKSKRGMVILGAIVLVLAGASSWFGMRWYRANKVKEFLPIAQVFMARVEARDVATLKRLGLDSAGIANALAIPQQQVTAIVRGKLTVFSGQIDNDFARVIFDTNATFCPANTGHPGLLEVQFIKQGGRWIVDRADPATC